MEEALIQQGLAARSRQERFTREWERVGRDPKEEAASDVRDMPDETLSEELFSETSASCQPDARGCLPSARGEVQATIPSATHARPSPTTCGCNPRLKHRCVHPSPPCLEKPRNQQTEKDMW